MAGFINGPQEDTGLFVATTDVYEINQLASVDVNSEEFRLLLVRLYQNLNNIVLALNLKDSAYYVLTEFLNGQVFFQTTGSVNDEYRQAYRIVVDIGPLNAGVTTVNHTIPVTADYTFTRIYGTATDSMGNNYYPIPFAGAAGAYISLMANATQVVIDNNSGVTFTACIVVLEYLKN